MENMTKKVVAGATEMPAHVAARRNYIDTIRSGYGAMVAYAKALNKREDFADQNGKRWYEVGGKEVNDFAKIVNGERDAFYAECDAAGVKAGTYRKRWKEVRDRAKIEIEGEVEQPEPTPRELDQYIPEESLKMYKRIARAEKRSAKAAKALKLVQQLCETYGIDLSNI